MTKPLEELTVDDLNQSAYINTASLGGKARTVTFVSINPYEMVGNPPEPELVITLNTGKKWIVKATNRNLIAEIHGRKIKEWVGKQVVLYPALTQFAGRPCEGIRVRRANGAAPPTAAPEAPQPGAIPAEPDDDWDDA